MAINTIGVTPAANFNPTIWATDLSDAVEANIVLASLVDRQYEKELKSMGRVVVINDMSNPAVRIKTEDTSATYSNVTETQQTITVSRQAYCAFLVEDIEDVQAHVDLRSRYTDKTGYSLMAFIEGDATSGLMSLPASFSQLRGTLGSDPTPDTIIDAKSDLDRADVPMNDRFMYMSPGFHNALLKQAVFTSSDYVGVDGAKAASANGRLAGHKYGAPIYVSTLAANSPAVTGQAYGWFCHKRGVALIIQRGVRVHEQYILLETGTGVLADVIYNFAERLILPKTFASTTPDDKFNVGLRGPA
jgi:hypothetical protein